jgi:hypothetical protein
MSDITLRHSVHSMPVRVEYFYDGLAVARDGLISIPAENREHIRAAFFRGYQDTHDGRRLNDFQELDSYIDEQATKTAKSAEVDHEGSDTRRQSTTKHGIRAR